MQEGLIREAQQLTFEVPAGWTVDTLLELARRAAGKEARKPGDPVRHCWKGEICAFWVQTGNELWQGDCGLGSCECLTRVFNKKPPTRWMSKDSINRLEDW